MSTPTGARTTGPQQARPTRRVHPFNTVTGLAFLAVVALWLVADQDVLAGREVGRAVAIALIVLGTGGVVGTVLVGRRSRRPLGADRAPGPDPDLDVQDDDAGVDAPGPRATGIDGATGTDGADPADGTDPPR